MIININNNIVAHNKSLESDKSMEALHLHNMIKYDVNNSKISTFLSLNSQITVTTTNNINNYNTN